METVRERANLGRTEPWLRAIGFAIWAFVGASRLVTRSGGGAAHAVGPWLGPWLVYGIAFTVASLGRRLRHPSRLALLIAQAASVLCLPWLGLGGFEGLLLAVVVAQAPTVLSLRHAAFWAVGQAFTLFVVVYPLKNAKELLEILGAYSSFSAFALLVYRLHLQEQRARSDLAEANAALLASHALLVEGSRQGERLRISRELHDSLGHHLTALGLQLELARQLAEGAAAEPVEKARALTRESLDEVRRVVSSMQASAKMDLIPGLRALAGGIIVPRISVTASDELAALDVEIGHALFRCIQEAITNSVKHARAQNVWVDVRSGTRGLDVVVRDDGRGVREVTPGTGLEGIRARASRVGGRAEFSSTSGQGFVVRIAVPWGAAP
jgi:signal transduction histidine kinase